MFMCHPGIHLLECVNPSQVQYKPALFGTLSKVSLRGTSALYVASLCALSSPVPLILIDTKASACRYQPNMSLRNENFPSFRWQLYVPVPLSGLPADI